MVRIVVAVLLLVATGCTPDYPITSFSDAVETGNTDEVRLHLYWCRKNGGCDIEEGSFSRGGTKLHAASERGHAETVRVLLEADAYTEAMNARFETPVMAAAARPFMGLPGNNAEAIQLLLEAGANIEAVNLDNETALHLASHWGNFEAVRVLLEAGANVHAKNDSGSTPLDKAKSKHGHPDYIPGRRISVRLLMEAGATE